MNNLGAFCLAVVSVGIASFSQVLLKKSAAKKYRNIISEYMNYYVIIGYALLGVSTIFSVLALTVLTIQDIALIETTSYLMVMILGHFLLNEKITKGKVTGNLLILFGILLFYL